MNRTEILNTLNADRRTSTYKSQKNALLRYIDKLEFVERCAKASRKLTADDWHTVRAYSTAGTPEWHCGLPYLHPIHYPEIWKPIKEKLGISWNEFSEFLEFFGGQE